MFNSKDMAKLEEMLGRIASSSNTNNTEKYSEEPYDSQSNSFNDYSEKIVEKLMNQAVANKELIDKLSKCEEEINKLKESQTNIKMMTAAVTRVSNLIAIMSIVSIIGIIIFIAIAVYAHFTSDYVGSIFYILGIIGLSGLYGLFKLYSTLEKLSEKELKQ